ncbi:MAG: hypothetical protein E6312_02480 [Peptoniphilus grossensis]|uniref:hypothetical protein n=1 Tax=Peptoniphilus grossensis TaxID=1465756 RepID=UPI00290E664F|nr:hypothetical protein [Peptoniphilus grossensis]MDU7150918.1 hypothetical protein [Peptoniphilus grossensis]
MNKNKFPQINYYGLIKIGIFLFLFSPLNSALAMFFQGSAYQWPFRIFFILLSIIGLIGGFLLFWYLLFSSLFYYWKKDREKARAHLVHFLALAFLPLIPILVSLIFELSQAGLHSLPKIGDLFYPAGGKAYTEFLPFLLEELKKILSHPSYIIPYD